MDGFALDQDGDLDQLLTSRLFDTLGILNTSLEQLADAYHLSVHQWVPLIQPSTLRDKLATLRSAPLAELATFMLQLVLVVPPSSFSRSRVPILDPHLSRHLYSRCRDSFSLLQANRRDCLLTIQSGILLSIHEQSQRLYSDAYISLSACASLGYVMGLDSNADFSDPFSLEKKLAWHAIYFGDVVNKLSLERCSRPMLVPAYATFTKRSIPWNPSPELLDSPATFESSWSRNFAKFDHIDRQAEAVKVLHRVLQLTRHQAVCLETLVDQEVWKLDFLIQEGIRNAISAPSNRLEHQYSLVVIFLL